MAKHKDLTGNRYNRLTVLSFAGTDRKGNASWHCSCACGNKFVTQAQSLKNGDSQSCGCLHRELVAKRSSKHNLSRTGAAQSWYSMMERCTNPRCAAYPLYGGRGITVCERWKDIRNFVADMGERPDGLEIDRIDNNGNYEPDNCRWASKKQQARNRRTARLITHDGVTRSLIEWAETLGVPYNRLAARYRASGRLIPTRHYRLRDSSAKA